MQTQALRCGLTVAAFWDLTPRETWLTIEAALWREESAQKRSLSQAWLTAALSRRKRLPALARLLNPPGPAKVLRGPELDKRRNEFRDMTRNVDVSKLNKATQ